MTGDDFGHLAYLLVILVFVGFWVFGSQRQRVSKSIQHLAIWGLIFLGAIAAVGLWDDIRSTVQPVQTVMQDENRIELPRAPDGHFHATLVINGQSVKFIVDTGASDMVLSKQDATRAGLDPDNLPYFGRAMTANGEVKTAFVRLDEVRFGSFTDRNVAASVNGGEMSGSLLGMSYLNRFAQITIAGNKLILTR
ncbi:retropepsin-like aspartic protease family protein [Shimia haliotis]|uniref:Aspartyl protease family protein n=1 Tax=Shimia haliotis TaxID=1280847 RepID=A0A1I4AT17_9RHOB|nr:TIGR02281 family clan AA aspartic protease [Shimia haliotis]SFK59625.1 aspartyl protease family protein [Shimia haliotis]